MPIPGPGFQPIPAGMTRTRPSFRYGLAESSDRDVIDRLKYRQGLLHAATPACWQTGLPSSSVERLGLRILDVAGMPEEFNPPAATPLPLN